MAAQPKKKTSKVRSKTRRAHNHTSLVPESMWHTGQVTKQDRREKYAILKRKKNLSTAATSPASAETKPATATKPAKVSKPKATPKPKADKKKEE